MSILKSNSLPSSKGKGRVKFLNCFSIVGLYLKRWKITDHFDPVRKPLYQLNERYSMIIMLIEVNDIMFT